MLEGSRLIPAESALTKAHSSGGILYQIGNPAVHRYGRGAGCPSNGWRHGLSDVARYAGFWVLRAIKFAVMTRAPRASTLWVYSPLPISR